MLPVILSGGQGTRLWPASNSSTPKPFVRLPDGETLISKTLERALALDPQHLIIITNIALYEQTASLISESPKTKTQIHLILESAVKNTAPAVITAAAYVEKHIGSKEALLVMPADHLIENIPEFISCAKEAESLSQQSFLATFGICPTHPETNYGYIKAGEPIPNGFSCQVRQFVEKPDAPTARQYIDSGDYYWNAGIFCFSVERILESADENCPGLTSIARTCVADETARIGDLKMLSINAEAFDKFPEISIDYAIMERDSRIAMVKARFIWMDMGSWLAFSTLAPPDSEGNAIFGEALVKNCKDSIIWSSGKPCAVAGLSGVAVIDTGKALLVCSKDSFQYAKLAYEKFEGKTAFAETVFTGKGCNVNLKHLVKGRPENVDTLPGWDCSLELLEGEARLTGEGLDVELEVGKKKLCPAEGTIRIASSTATAKVLCCYYKHPANQMPA